MTKQEILPPIAASAAGDRGAWEKGGPSPNPAGKPKGAVNHTTRELREAIMQSFETVGGADYLTILAFTRPDLYVALLGRVLPIKLAGDDEAHRTPIALVRRVIVDPQK